MASRTLISRCRPVARASIRLATLAQAMSSTSPTMPISTATGPDRSPRICDRPREASCSTQGLGAEAGLELLGRGRELRHRLELVGVDLLVAHVGGGLGLLAA